MSERLDAIEATLGITIPPRVQALYDVADGRYNEGGQWWFVWKLDRLVHENTWRWETGLPRTLFAFGDNGCGDPFCVPLDPPTDVVVCWLMVGSEVDTLVGPIAEFLETWTNC